MTTPKDGLHLLPLPKNVLWIETDKSEITVTVGGFGSVDDLLEFRSKYLAEAMTKWYKDKVKTENPQ